MLAIRLQRTGRRGQASYRVVVQDSHRSPKSGRVVARLGSYDPHSKETILDKEKAKFYLDHGAQPSDRMVRLFKSESVKLPNWVAPVDKKKKSIKNPDKLRRNRPAEVEKPAEKVKEEVEAPAEEVKTVEAEQPADAPTAETEEAPSEEPKEESAKETKAEKPESVEPTSEAEPKNKTA